MNGDHSRELWLFISGALFAAGKVTREELLAMFSSLMTEAPSDILQMLDGLCKGDAAVVRSWFRDRKVEMGGGNGTFKSIANTMLAVKKRELVGRLAQEIHMGRHLDPVDFTTLLEQKLKELE